MAIQQILPENTFEEWRLKSNTLRGEIGDITEGLPYWGNGPGEWGDSLGDWLSTFEHVYNIHKHSKLVIPSFDPENLLATDVAFEVNDSRNAFLRGNQFSMDVHAGASQPNTNLYGYGGTPSIRGYRSEGVKEARTPTVSESVLLDIIGNGFHSGGGGTWADRVGIKFKAWEQWSETNHGTFIQFFTTEANTTSKLLRLELSGKGNLLPGVDAEQEIGLNGLEWWRLWTHKAIVRQRLLVSELTDVGIDCDDDPAGDGSVPGYLRLKFPDQAIIDEVVSDIGAITPAHNQIPTVLAVKEYIDAQVIQVVQTNVYDYVDNKINEAIALAIAFE